jgi:hypothetical protein
MNLRFPEKPTNRERPVNLIVQTTQIDPDINRELCRLDRSAASVRRYVEGCSAELKVSLASSFLRVAVAFHQGFCFAGLEAPPR